LSRAADQARAAGPLLADGIPDPASRARIRKLAAHLAPHTAALGRGFAAGLRRAGYGEPERKALSEITPGAAAALFANRGRTAAFFEQVGYNGRRLAKLGVAPEAAAASLDDYAALVDPLLDSAGGLREAARELRFATLLALKDCYYEVRDAESRALFELFHAELEAVNLAGLLERFEKTLTGFCRACDGRLLLFPGPGEPPSAIRRALSRPRYLEGRAADRLVLDARLRGRCTSYWSVPLPSPAGLAGVMQFGFPVRYRWLPRELKLLEAAGERCRKALEKARLTEDLAASEVLVRKLSEHMLKVEEEERRRISRELHDEAGQSMLYIRLQMEMLEQGLPENSAERAKAGEIRQLTEHAIGEIRRVISALSPAVLEQMGLAAAVRQLVNRFRQACRVDARVSIPETLGPLPQQTEFVVYRLAQECLNNVAKHARASHINLRMVSTDRWLMLDVADDGAGFDVEAALRKQDSFGLPGMKERVALLGGSLEIQSTPGSGTRISAKLPIQKESGSGPTSGGTARPRPH
jgi:signal transduction histidine kinase